MAPASASRACVASFPWRCHVTAGAARPGPARGPRVPAELPQVGAGPGSGGRGTERLRLLGLWLLGIWLLGMCFLGMLLPRGLAFRDAAPTDQRCSIPPGMQPAPRDAAAAGWGSLSLRRVQLQVCECRHHPWGWLVAGDMRKPLDTLYPAGLGGGAWVV